jgi:hypothetical protein
LRQQGFLGARVTSETAVFLEALGELEQALAISDENTERMRRRIEYLRGELRAGRTLTETVPEEETPLLVQLLTDSAALLHTYGTRVRRTEALALYREGVTMDRIARLFGVSRQRVSALLRDGTAQDGTEAGAPE